jgi:hypothetical protein
MSLSTYTLPRNARGVTVTDLANLFRVRGRTKAGRQAYATVDMGFWRNRLNPLQREEIYEKSDIAHGLIGGRALEMSALPVSIVNEAQVEDEIEAKLRSWKRIHEWQEPTARGAGVRITAFRMMRQHLPWLHMSLDNFESHLLDWRHKLDRRSNDKAQQILDWFMQPSPGLLWPDFISKWTHDLLTHNAAPVYLMGPRSGPITGFQCLPAGTVLQAALPFAGLPAMYVQFPFEVWMGGRVTEPRIYFRDELSFSQYEPVSMFSNPSTPMDALVEYIAHQLLFAEQMASKADGSELPQKLVIAGQNVPTMPSGLPGEAQKAPVSKTEEFRLDNRLNRLTKRALQILSGNYYGNIQVVDVSKTDQLPAHIQWIRDGVRDACMAVFHATPAEVGKGGSEGISGRSTAEMQERTEKSKGLLPVVVRFVETANREILPRYTGERGWMVRIEAPLGESAQADLALKYKQSEVVTGAEIRALLGKRLQPLDKPELMELVAAGGPGQQLADGMQSLMQPRPGG